MTINTNPNVFSHRQMTALQNGHKLRQRMCFLIANLTENNQLTRYNNLYIYSPPGLGKTHSVKQFLENADIPFYTITGNTSLFAFGIQLAVIKYIYQNNEPIIIHVDDCDEIFKNEPNCNAMKRLLDREKKFVYEKSLTSQWSSLTDLQKDALKYFGEDGKMGFVVPADNIRFVFTSNFQLPTDDEVAESRKKGKTKSILMAHRNAIRSRCKVAEFDLKFEEHWGWLGSVVLSPEFFIPMGITMDDAITIIKFLWDNWHYLNERSIRLIEKMSETLLIFPETYHNVWQIDHLKNYRQYEEI